MLLAKNLTFYRTEKKVFENISLSLSPKKIIKLSGKNGSGKTTLLKILINILIPSSGSIYWKGKIINKNLYDFYNNMTFISDKTTSIRYLSVIQNIQIWKKIFISKIDLSQIEQILNTLGLDKIQNKKVSSLSMGEIKKLEMLRLVLENKKVWLLDEPFTNLDTDSIELLKQTFQDHCYNEGSIIFSSHQMIEMRVDDEVVF
tara:strand:- start:14191 stop:14796 length:606 start_codon:yes stop_codon:yes gene_type:complete